MLFQTGDAIKIPMLSESEIQELFSFINQQQSGEATSSGSNRAEERKVRRMQSNRESARQSRCRKKKHIENLTSCQLNLLRIENRELKNQIAFTMHHHLLLSLQNDHLISESVALFATLSDLVEILDNNNPSEEIGHNIYSSIPCLVGCTDEE